MAKKPNKLDSVQENNSLTPDQLAKIEEYKERFRQIGMSTAPTDKSKAEEFIRRAYVYLHKNEQPTRDFSNLEFVWAKNPLEGAKLAAQYTKGDVNVTDEEIHAQATTASYGSFEAYWVATYVYMAEVLGTKKDELVDIILDITKECGVYWTFEDLVVMTPKPTKIHVKDDKLHNTDGPALEYEDYSVYAINGNRKGSLMEVALAAKIEDNG